MARTSTKPQPVLSVRFGTVSTAIWENRNSDNEPFHTCELRRSYRDNDNRWQDQKITMSVGEIAKTASALQTTLQDYYQMLNRKNASQSSAPSEPEM